MHAENRYLAVHVHPAETYTQPVSTISPPTSPQSREQVHTRSARLQPKGMPLFVGLSWPDDGASLRDMTRLCEIPRNHRAHQEKSWHQDSAAASGSNRRVDEGGGKARAEVRFTWPEAENEKCRLMVTLSVLQESVQFGQRQLLGKTSDMYRDATNASGADATLQRASIPSTAACTTAGLSKTRLHMSISLDCVSMQIAQVAF